MIRLVHRRSHQFLIGSAVFVLLFALSSCAMRTQRYADIRTPTPFFSGDILILGFMGGRDSFRDQRVGVGRLASRLRQQAPPGVHVETIENMKRGMALAFLKRGLDHDRDGALDASERNSAKIILYGQSFGGAAVVKFARQLHAIGVPVLLTVQVDSVGRDDEVIPPNVKAAANFYQSNGLIIRGESAVRPSDPERTTIVFNRRLDYRYKKIKLENVTWYKKLLRTAHVKMDNDPELWAEVEGLILQAVQKEKQ